MSLSTRDIAPVGNVLRLFGVFTTPPAQSGGPPSLDKEGSKASPVTYVEENEHLIFRDGVVAGENVIKLDFTSPILPSGSAITRYVDKEDGSEYIYSLFVPSDASTAFPVFDQPDLKARFSLTVDAPKEWRVVTNVDSIFEGYVDAFQKRDNPGVESKGKIWKFYETKPISTYVFAFAAGAAVVSFPAAVLFFVPAAAALFFVPAAEALSGPAVATPHQTASAIVVRMFRICQERMTNPPFRRPSTMGRLGVESLPAS